MPPSPPVHDSKPTTSSPDQPSSSSPFLIPPHPLSTSRYNRQLLVPSISIRGQEAISKAKVLIIGLGGLGSPASLYLATAGIGTLGLIDADTVDLSNLHRQILHTEAAVGESKVRSAMRTLRAHNKDEGVRVMGYEMPFTGAEGVGVVEGEVEGMEAGVDGEVMKEGGKGRGLVEGGYDIILDCTDNPASRYLISDVCVALGKVLVTAAAQRGEGQLMRLCYPPPINHPERKMEGTAARGPCYRCIFPTAPSPETVHPCSEIGILGPVVGVMGTLMAMEVLRILTTPTTTNNNINAEGAWRPTLLLYNALSPDPRTMFRSVGLRRAPRKDCLACGDADLLQQMGGKKKITRQRIKSGEVNYDAFCGRVEDVKVLKKENRVSAGGFVERMKDRSVAVVVDVREEVEYELGAKIEGSVNIPLSRILRAGGDGKQLGLENLVPEVGGPGQGGEGQTSEKSSIYFVCQRGNDSQIAAKRFLDAKAESGGTGNRWIGDVVGGFEALQIYHS